MPTGKMPRWWGRQPFTSSFYNLEWQAVFFFLGGSVKGGLHGTMPSLGDLQEGDLKYRVDHRSLYTTVIRSWWGIPETAIVGGGVSAG